MRSCSNFLCCACHCSLFHKSALTQDKHIWAARDKRIHAEGEEGERGGRRGRGAEERRRGGARDRGTVHLAVKGWENRGGAPGVTARALRMLAARPSAAT
jgi:hypothetical protein